mgnify:CR=1 FL=1
MTTKIRGEDFDISILRYARIGSMHPNLKTRTTIPKEPDWKPTDLKRLAKAGFLEARKNYSGEGVHYILTDKGRAAAREGQEGHNLLFKDARAKHDTDLSRVWAGHPVANAVLAGRGEAATVLRQDEEPVFECPVAVRL